MAKCIFNVRVTNIGTEPSANPTETMQKTNLVAEYSVCDDGDPTMRKRGRVSLADITGAETIDAWWASVIAAVNAAEGIV